MRHARLAGGAALLAPILLLASPVLAAGGAHVIDDSAVETPGVCHLESWVTRYGGDHGLVNLSPACTRTVWPHLEIGGALQSTWSASASDTTIGPALKFTLRSEDTGIGLGAVGNGSWSVRSGQLETANLIAPATFVVSDRVRINLNAGWSYSRASPSRNALFYGGQAEIGLLPNTSLMIEAFRRDHGPAGGQLGLRWNPGGGRFDLDLLAGQLIDGTSRRAVTLGLTVRR